MDYFPIFLDLRGQPVLVVGGGRVAERKIRLLLSAGAAVHVAARRLSDAVSAWQAAGRLASVTPAYRPAQLGGKRLAFAATDDAALNRRVFGDGEARGVPVNVVDDRAHCRFISPAIVDRSPVQVAISTGGRSPVLARRIRARIERVLPSGLGRVARLLGELRAEVIDRTRPSERRAAWEALLTWPTLTRWCNVAGRVIRGEVLGALEQGQPSTRGAGMVYLVGAGPGNPGLLTLRALEVMGQADVILHDRLVSEEILDLARRDADRVYVGKAAGNHHRVQDEIHDLMRDAARQGKTVVRLKGGDPFVFGRGGEELADLKAAGIRCEVVPGVTAATGCAAYAGIPLTHRDHAGALALITGHDAAAIDWRGCAGEGRTVAVYMGVSQAETIRDGLLRDGIPADFPVALVVDGSLPTQQVIHGFVGELPLLAARARKRRPGLLVIGQVAALGSTLNWIETMNELQHAA